MYTTGGAQLGMGGGGGLWEGVKQPAVCPAWPTGRHRSHESILDERIAWYTSLYTQFHRNTRFSGPMHYRTTRTAQPDCTKSTTPSQSLIKYTWCFLETISISTVIAHNHISISISLDQTGQLGELNSSHSHRESWHHWNGMDCTQCVHSAP